MPRPCSRVAVAVRWNALATAGKDKRIPSQQTRSRTSHKGMSRSFMPDYGARFWLCSEDIFRSHTCACGDRFGIRALTRTGVRFWRSFSAGKNAEKIIRGDERWPPPLGKGRSDFRVAKSGWGSRRAAGADQRDPHPSPASPSARWLRPPLFKGRRTRPAIVRDVELAPTVSPLCGAPPPPVLRTEGGKRRRWCAGL